MGSPTFDPEYDVPLFHCSECGRELRKDSCGKCGTEGNPASNWIPNGKKERPTPPAPADDATACPECATRKPDDGDWWARHVLKATDLAALKSIAEGWPMTRPAARDDQRAVAEAERDDVVRAALAYRDAVDDEFFGRGSRTPTEQKAAESLVLARRVVLFAALSPFTPSRDATLVDPTNLAPKAASGHQRTEQKEP